MNYIAILFIIVAVVVANSNLSRELKETKKKLADISDQLNELLLHK